MYLKLEKFGSTLPVMGGKQISSENSETLTRV